jgi:two-component system, chemotaxis family, chemotaxis protein CheY
MPDRRLKIVIADDDAFLREMLRVLLRSDDYDVVGEAPNGEVALELCTRLRPDIALLDINMPVKDGLAVLDALKGSNSPSRVVMMSAEATLDKVKLAVEKGAAGFIVKPFTSGTVLEELRDRLKPHP